MYKRQLSSCFVEQSGFAWNHGDFQEQITRTWLGVVGPGVQALGQVDTIFSDHTDIRPTMMALTGLQDSYAHDGRVLAEILKPSAIATTMQPLTTYLELAQIFKIINAPRQILGQATLTMSTNAMLGNDTSYSSYLGQIGQITATRNVLVQLMTPALE